MAGCSRDWRLAISIWRRWLPETEHLRTEHSASCLQHLAFTSCTTHLIFFKKNSLASPTPSNLVLLLIKIILHPQIIQDPATPSPLPLLRVKIRQNDPLPLPPLLRRQTQLKRSLLPCPQPTRLPQPPSPLIPPIKLLVLQQHNAPTPHSLTRRQKEPLFDPPARFPPILHLDDTAPLVVRARTHQHAPLALVGSKRRFRQTFLRGAFAGEGLREAVGREDGGCEVAEEG